MQDKTLTEKLEMLKEKFSNHSNISKKTLDNQKDNNIIKENETQRTGNSDGGSTMDPTAVS